VYLCFGFDDLTLMRDIAPFACAARFRAVRHNSWFHYQKLIRRQQVNDLASPHHRLRHGPGVGG
jgi:hypothetical protein